MSSRLVLCLLALNFLLTFNLSSAKSKIVVLDEDNWPDMLYGEWMVEFFAPWCPACKALQPVWKEFASWSDDLGIKVGQVDVTASPGLSGRFMVTALPTIFHIKDGVFRQYRGSREKDEIISFIEEKKWLNLEEVPAWKSPASLQMSVVAQFFKLSMVLRGVHTTLVEDYGLPTWGSYLVFALSTVLIGAMLGLILVCVIDFMFPPKDITPIPVMKSSVTAGKNSDEEDLIEDKEDEKEEDAGDEIESEDKECDNDKGSQSEEEPASSQAENSEPEANSGSASGSPTVRKRRSRKAD